MVGDDHWLFAVGGRNEPLKWVTQSCPETDQRLLDWKAVVSHRISSADDLGITLQGLIVPNKLITYPEKLNGLTLDDGMRRAECLTGAFTDTIFYPLERLREAKTREQVFLKTDSHVTRAGAELLYMETMKALDLECSSTALSREVAPLDFAGDLGSRFNPPFREVIEQPQPFATVELVEDTSADFWKFGRHLGTCQRSFNSAALHQAKVLILGGSHCSLTNSPSSVGTLLAGTFREVHFVWAPFQWDSRYIEAIAPDIVLLQTNERFLFEVPPLESDLFALCTVPSE